MRWTVAYFKYKKEEWEMLATTMEYPGDGLKCYAYKQANMWEKFESDAKQLFSSEVQF